jgi:hypothetical protein
VVVARGVPVFSTIAAEDSGISFGFAQDGLSRAPDTRAGMTKKTLRVTAVTVTIYCRTQ